MRMQAAGGVVEQVAKLLHDILDELPAGCASFRTKSQEEFNDGIWFELLPSLPTAAKVGVIVDDDKVPVIYLVLGDHGTTIEALVDKKLERDFRYLEDVRTLLSSVIAGKFEETVWLVGNKAFKSNAKIEVEGKWRKWWFRHAFYPFRRAKKVHVRYSPYFSPVS